MFLHLGGELTINLKDLVGIMDIKSALKSRDTRSFLKKSREEGYIKKVSQEEPRSFVIVERGKRTSKSYTRTTIYESPISAVTLQKRAGFIDSLPNFQDNFTR